MRPQEIQETVDFIYVAIYGPLVVGTIIYLIWQKRKNKKNQKEVDDLDEI